MSSGVILWIIQLSDKKENDEEAEFSDSDYSNIDGDRDPVIMNYSVSLSTKDEYMNTPTVQSNQVRLKLKMPI